MLPREVFFTLPLRIDMERMGMRSPLASNPSMSSSSSSMQTALVFLKIGRGARHLPRRRFYFRERPFRFLSCWAILKSIVGSPARVRYRRERWSRSPPPVVKLHRPRPAVGIPERRHGSSPLFSLLCKESEQNNGDTLTSFIEKPSTDHIRRIISC